MGRKLLAGALPLLLCSMQAGPAAAEEILSQDRFSASAPAGWSGRGLGDKVVFTAPDHSETVVVSVSNLDGLQPEELGGLVVARLNGPGLVVVRDNRCRRTDAQGRDGCITVDMSGDGGQVITIDSISYK